MNKISDPVVNAGYFQYLDANNYRVIRIQI